MVIVWYKALKDTVKNNNMPLLILTCTGPLTCARIYASAGAWRILLTIASWSAVVILPLLKGLLTHFERVLQLKYLHFSPSPSFYFHNSFFLSYLSSLPQVPFPFFFPLSFISYLSTLPFFSYLFSPHLFLFSFPFNSPISYLPSLTLPLFPFSFPLFSCLWILTYLHFPYLILPRFTFPFSLISYLSLLPLPFFPLSLFYHFLIIFVSPSPFSLFLPAFFPVSILTYLRFPFPLPPISHFSFPFYLFPFLFLSCFLFSS